MQKIKDLLESHERAVAAAKLSHEALFQISKGADFKHLEIYTTGVTYAFERKGSKEAAIVALRAMIKHFESIVKSTAKQLKKAESALDE